MLALKLDPGLKEAKYYCGADMMSYIQPAGKERGRRLMEEAAQGRPDIRATIDKYWPRPKE